MSAQRTSELPGGNDDPGDEVEGMLRDLCVAEGASNEYEEEEEEYEDVDAPASGDSTGSESGKGGFLSRAWNATKKAAATASSKLARRAETNPRLKAAAEACRHPLAHPGGGLINTDTEGVAVSRQVVAEVAREVGKKLMAGQNLLSVTFPVRCCQPKTILEVASGQFVFCPEYLTRAAEESDPVERLKLVVACFIGCIHTTSNVGLKPFNPTLGETFQAEFAGGTQLHLEQTSHHPPITSWQLHGPEGSFHYYGFSTYTAGFGYNRMYIKQRGRRVCAFADGTRIEVGFTMDRMNNVLWGDVVHEVLGGYTFVDDKHGLACKIELARFRGCPSDVFAGAIERVGADGQPAETLCAVEGSWLGFCDFDGKRYWDLKREPAVPQPLGAPLPSDSRFRRDRCLLGAGDVEAAQAAKTVIEERQRRERRLRAAAAKAREEGVAFDASAVK